MKKLFYTAILLAVSIMLIPVVADAQVTGTIYRKDGGQATGAIRFLPASKSYEIRVNNVTVTLSENDIARIVIQKPAEIDQAAQFMARKQYSSAIPLLNRVLNQYKNLQWDSVAMRGLAECYFESGMVSEGIKMVDDAMRGDPSSLSPAVVMRYWDELIKNREFPKVERSIEVIIASGARSLAAVAQIRRGDVLKEKGQIRDALVDGYLRTVVFFQEEKDAREEAAYKAMRAFQDLGQQTYADRMRRILVSDYPRGEWTKKAQAGS